LLVFWFRKKNICQKCSLFGANEITCARATNDDATAAASRLLETERFVGVARTTARSPRAPKTAKKRLNPRERARRRRCFFPETRAKLDDDATAAASKLLRLT
jgi:hypothetical protein